MTELGAPTIEHGSTRSGRWLHARRVRLVLWIAFVEAILVALLHDVSRWTVIVVAIVAVAVYFFFGRESKSDTVREATWIAAASQALAVIAVLFAFVFFWIAIVVALIFAAIALLILFTDRH
jgi:Ca2+/Na+ antiporter